MATTHHAAEPAQGVIDPVCGMTIDPADAVGHHDYKGQTYYFCAESCLEQFRDNPERFLHPDMRAAAPVDLEAEYTCPMHPEVRQKGPGACPICGMALEPVDATHVEERNVELEDMTRRFFVSLAFTVPAIVVGGALVQDVSLAASAGPEGWTIESFRARMPGQATLDASGQIASGAFSFKGNARLAVAQPATFATWRSSPKRSTPRGPSRS